MVTGTVTATDNCDTSVVISFADVTVEGACPQTMTITRTWNVADACGNSSSCVQHILVEDSTPPAITCPVDLTIECNTSSDPLVTGTATATDNCDTSIIITFADITTAGACPQSLTISRTWNAVDACGNSTECTQTIFVQDTVAPILTCPVDITVDCNTSIATAVTGDATATDNCDATPTIGFDDVTAAGACPQSYIITRTFTAIDDCGNSSSCAQIIFVQDTMPPAITCPVDLTIECSDSSDPIATGSASATDNCDTSVVITYADVTVEGACAQSMTIIRTWNAADGCGNSSTCVQNIFVQDTTPPAITCPVDLTIECNTSSDPMATGSATAMDNCDMNMIITYADLTVAGACPQSMTITRTWNVADACGNSGSCVQHIFVEDSTVPVIACPAPVTVSCASQVPVADINSVTASDVCGTVTITYDGDAISNQTCVNRYTITRTYRATDACGNSATCAQIITVNDQTPPTINCPGNLTIDVSASTLPQNTGTPTSSDNCSGVPTLTFSDVTAAAGVCSSSYLITRTWTSSDACGNSATCIQTIAVTGNCVVDLALVKTLDAGQGELSGGENINFTITVTNQGEVTIGSVSIVDYIPIGFSLNDVDWTPGNAGSSGQSASITLSIANGGLGPNGLIAGASVSVPITLQADVNIPPGIYYNSAEITNVIDINGVDVTMDDIDSTPDDIDTNDPPGEDDHSLAAICILPHPVILGDPYVCPGELVTYSVENPNPNNTYIWTLSGGGFIAQNNGSSIQVQWQQPAGGPFQITVQESGSQTCQNSGFLIVFIQGLDPIACNDNIQISLDSNGVAYIDPTMILEGEDPNNNNYYVVITDQFGNVLTDPYVNCSYVGQTLIAAVHNICNNQSCWGRISIEDKLPPHILCTCPVGNTDTACDITCLEVHQLVAGQIPPQLQPTVTDNCSATVAISHIDLNDEGCGGGYIRVTWLATDIGGNTATCVQQFNIVPLTLSTLVCPPAYIGACGTSTDPDVTGWPTVSGHPLSDEGGLCNIFTGYWDHPLVDCGGGQKIQRTWTILDWCTQQLVECVQIIKLTDTEGPVLTCPYDMTVGTDFWYCYANFSVPKPQAVDNCSEIESYQLIASAGTVVSFGNNFVVNNLPLGTHILQWIVSDECGNSSSCSFKVTVEDNVAPVANCDAHTIVSLTNDGPSGITLVPAEVFDDGSYDNCGPVTFRARRIESCIDIDWTTDGACIDDIPGGVPPVNSRDRGTVHRPCVPFSCCDVGAGPVMVELEVTDAAGNKNYCVVEAEVQDKISAYIECPPDIIVSCEYWFPAVEGTYTDATGNHNGNLDEDPLSRLFGNMYDAFDYDESIRQPIIINDPGNHNVAQPHNWGLDGWADDNCEVNLQVRDRIVADCSGGDLPANAPAGAVKLIERRFIAEGASGDAAPATCTQRIWVVDFEPFYITDNTCNNNDPNDGVIWPCDVILTTCPDDISDTGEPVIFDDACNLIGVTYEDTRFDFVEGACYKILRNWAVIDWCQYNSQTGYGLWHYTQVIKVHDNDGPVFLDCPTGPVTLCVNDPGVTLPDNNQAFLGEGNPLSSSCSVHLNLSKTVYEACSGVVQYDVKLYPFNGTEYLLLQGTTSAPVDSTHHAVLTFDTHSTPIQSVRLNGIPYNSPYCGDYHRILWSVEDGCGNWSHCEYLLRLEDCKQPSPVCINGLSTVIMPIGGQVTIWAKDFNASSFDDCTRSSDLLYSFSGDSYQPSFTYTCDNVPAFGVEIPTQIWVADGGVDHNCNGLIEWSERNKDYCTTTIVISDNNNVCGGSGSILAGEVLNSAAHAVDKVNVTLNSVGHYFPGFTTAADGKFRFNHLEQGLDYSIVPERNDNPRNGVSTLDLVKIQKHLLGIEPFTSPYQYIAADANNNQAVSAIDLVEIRKLILGIYNKFPNNKSWRFVEKGFPMDTDHPWPFSESIFVPGLAVDSIMGNDFVAVKIGDVNNSAKANAQQVIPRNGRRVITATADACEVVAGETCVMTITLPEVLSGFQWTFETEGLEFEGIASDDINISDENVGLLDQGIVTMSWNGDVKPDQSAITMTITWKANTAGRFDRMIRMSDRVTPIEAYSPSGDILDVRMVFTGVQQEGDFALYQNKPNPWSGFTSIGFVLPEEGQATLTVYDVTGKEVYRTTGSFSSGYNTLLLSQKDIPHTGVMFYKLESGPYSASKKMVLIQ